MPGQAIVTIKDRQWDCSVASTPAELVTGLSGVPSMPPGTGMLFVLPQEQIVAVTAEGMLFPLDVIFIGDNLLVTEAVFSLMPGDYGTTNLPCKYFLEVNASEAFGIEGGDAVSIQITQAPGISDWMTPVVMIAGVMMVGALMAQVGKTMLEKPREKPEIYGPRGERLSPQTGRKGYAIAARRLVYDPELKRKKTEYVRQSKIYDDEWTANVFLKSWIKKHPHEEFKVIEVSSETQAQILPQTRKDKPARHDIEIGTWSERDRIGIWLTDKRTDKTIAEWWDEDAREMFEQGWFKPGDIRQQTITGRAFEESVLDYAENVGLLAVSGKYLPQTVKDAYYWTAINKDTGEITESFTPYTSSGRALMGGKTFASRHWKGYKALVEVWRQPFRYSESLYADRLKIEPVTSEMITLAKSPAVIPTEPRERRRRGKPGELEFLPDSPEFLAYTIDDIGYREKIDSAFQAAIARAKGR